MQFLRSKEGFPFSSAVIHSGKVLETVLTGQLPGETTPVPGGPAAEMQEIFRQLDEILAEAGLTKKTCAQPKSTYRMSIAMSPRSTQSGPTTWAITR